MMREDFVLLKKLAGFVNTVNETDEDGEQMVDLLSVIEELEKVEDEELDFRVEAENTRFFKENCIDDEEKITCPTVIDELTTERLFTMTFVDGYSISKRDRLIEEGYDPEQIGSVILDNYIHQVLDVGTFHADPHQGNILVSHGKPYWIDFGMIGHVTDKDIDLIQEAVKALLIQDADALVNAVMGMGAASEKTDRTKLTRDAEVFIQKYMNVKSVSDINVTEVFDEVMSLAAQNHVSMPGRFTMLARSLTTIEGVVEQLCPDLNLFDILYDKLKERARQNMNIPRELLEKGQELVNAGKKAAKIPLLASEVLEGMVKGKTKVRFELSGYEEPLNRIFHFLRYTVLTLVALVLFIGSCILCTTDFKPILANGVPLLAVAGIIFSIALAIYSIKKLK
jgi:ubiquinone biosynthesis protein